VQNLAPRSARTADRGGKSDLKMVGLKMVEPEKQSNLKNSRTRQQADCKNQRKPLARSNTCSTSNRLRARANPTPPEGGSGTPTSIQDDFLNRADRPEPAYLRAAQAYMLISMPTDTSTIFGVFQVIQTSMDLRTMAPHEIRTGIDVTQVVTSKRNVEPCTTTISAIGAARDPLWCSAPSRPGFRPCPDWPH
jgi:hypothetical protein